MRTPFKFRHENSSPDLPIGMIYGHRTYKGELGLEIEVEGNKFKKEALPAPWTYHHDGSLRGEDNAEYVYGKPVKFAQVEKTLDTLWDMFSEYGSVLDESNRTSVHVHLNVQDFYLNRLATFLGMYFSVEEILVQWCGDHRVGNLFCLRGKDAPGILSRVLQLLKTGERVSFSDGMHYGGVNIQAISKLGSLEFRSMRGCTDKNTILRWVNILERMYTLSADYTDPRTLVDSYSSVGASEYGRMLLGSEFDAILSEIGWSEYQASESLLEGIRMAQDVCYCRDWSEYKPMNIKPDPFGRSAKKVVESMAAMDTALPSTPSDSVYYDPAPVGAHGLHQCTLHPLYLLYASGGISATQFASISNNGGYWPPLPAHIAVAPTPNITVSVPADWQTYYDEASSLGEEF